MPEEVEDQSPSPGAIAYSSDLKALTTNSQLSEEQFYDGIRESLRQNVPKMTEAEVADIEGRFGDLLYKANQEMDRRGLDRIGVNRLTVR